MTTPRLLFTPSLTERRATGLRRRHGRTLFPAEAINHTDEEMEMLAALLQQRTAWQISGVRGLKYGRGQQYSPNRYRPVPAPSSPAAPAAPEPHYSPN